MDMFLKAGRKKDGETGPSWDAQAMMREIEAKWPETAKWLSPKLLGRLYQGIQDAALFVDTDELQLMLNCASKLDSNSKTLAETARFILGIVRKARCNVVTDPQPTFSVTEDSNMRLLRAVLHNLKVARAQADSFYEANAKQFGGTMLPLDQSQMWRQFSMAGDTATARL
jgi:hypothetical protein